MASSTKRASTTTTDLQNLELKVLHMTRTLSKFERDTPEWSFLNRKLEAAEEDLEGLRGGDAGVLSGQWNSNSHDDDDEDDDGEDCVVVWTSRGGDVDHPDPYSDDAYGGDEGGNNEGPFFDDTSFEDPEDLPPDDGKLTFSQVYDEDVAIPKAHSGRRNGLVPARMAFAVALSCIVVVVVVVALILSGNPRGGDNKAIRDSGHESIQQITKPCASFSMLLVPDEYGNETSWEIMRYDDDDDVVVLAGGPYAYTRGFDAEGAGGGVSRSEMVRATVCLEMGTYTFILYDSKGNGICCRHGRGEYGIYLSKGRVIRPLSPGRFPGAREVTQFEVTAADIEVLPQLTAATAIDDEATAADIDVLPQLTAATTIYDEATAADIDVPPQLTAATAIDDEATAADIDVLPQLTAATAIDDKATAADIDVLPQSTAATAIDNEATTADPDVLPQLTAATAIDDEATAADIDVLPPLTAATAIDDEATKVPSELHVAEDTSGDHDVVQAREIGMDSLVKTTSFRTGH